MKDLCAGSIWHESIESVRDGFDIRAFNLTVGCVEGTLWIIEVKVKSESKLAGAMDAIHAPVDQGVSIGRKQRFIVSALEMPLKPRNVDSLTQISHLESLISTGDGRLNEHELFEVRVRNRVRSGDLPLLPINRRQDLGLVNSKNFDGGVRHRFVKGRIGMGPASVCAFCLNRFVVVRRYLSRFAQYSGRLLPWATAQTVITDSRSE